MGMARADGAVRDDARAVALNLGRALIDESYGDSDFEDDLRTFADGDLLPRCETSLAFLTSTGK